MKISDKSNASIALKFYILLGKINRYSTYITKNISNAHVYVYIRICEKVENEQNLKFNLKIDALVEVICISQMIFVFVSCSFFP